LRAHPLLDDGIITGLIFGRNLYQGTIERTGWLNRTGPLRLGGAAFVDAARSGPAKETGSTELTADAGLGVRFGWPGGGRIRIDRAWGLSDNAAAWSIGWEEAVIP
jgi:outer membrane translocation and assembly module TamA